MNPFGFSAGFSITPMQPRQSSGYSTAFLRLAVTLLLASLTSIVARAEMLAGAVVENSSVYEATQIFDLYKAHLGQPVTDTTAVSIATALQARYVADGFARPGFSITDRGLASGIVRISLVEASISSVAINGSAGPYHDKLERLVAGLPADQSLKPQQIRDVMRQARRLPGLDLSVAAEPDGGASGGFRLELQSEYDPVEGQVRLSNRGTREIGREIVLARVVANGILGKEISGGLFGTSARDTDRYKGGGLYLSTALNAHGTVAQMQGAVTALAYETQGIFVEQDRKRLVLNVSQPVIRGAAHDLSLSAGLNAEDLDVAIAGETAREERLRSLELGSTFTWRRRERQYLLSLELEQGLNGFGSRIESVSAAEPLEEDFSIARLRYVRLSTLNDLWSWRFDGYAQASPHVLPSIKRFKVGGGRIGRGFEAAALSGDHGVGGKVQLKRRVGNRLDWLERGDLYGFYDLGSAWRNDRSGRESAASAGGGLELREGRLSGYLEVAKPLTHADADGRRDVGIFAELSLRF